jgi:DNA-binding beta-propeller fold protein YncE
MPVILYAVNANSQELRWGDPTQGPLSAVLPLGFACHSVSVLPDQRHLYITGNKLVAGVAHAWLAAIDTCGPVPTAELDLGVGFAGQCALPPGVGGPLAYVAISQAVGQTDTGPNGGTNRVAILDIAAPATPTQAAMSINVPGSPYGTLHIVWSGVNNTVYVSHRGDHSIFFFTSPAATLAAQPIRLTQQPTGLVLTQSGRLLVVGRRLAGELTPIEILTQPPTVGQAIPLQNALSQSTIELTAAGATTVLAAPFRPSDGFLNIVTWPAVGAPRVVALDTQGTSIGRVGISPDGAVAYVPRSDQNDIAQIDLATLALFPVFVGSTGQPRSVAAISHDARVRLETDPASISAACTGATPVTVRAFDACGVELTGLPLTASTTSSLLRARPGQGQTPAQFSIECVNGGAGTVNFTTIAFPIVTHSLPVQCNCPTLRCADFSSLAPGPLGAMPLNWNGIAISIAFLAAPNRQPRIVRGGIQLNRSGVRFQLAPGAHVNMLTVKIRRRDSEPPVDEVTVLHAGGTTPVPSSYGQLQTPRQGPPWEIVCPFQGITEWTIAGSAETVVTEICFFA